MTVSFASSAVDSATCAGDAASDDSMLTERLLACVEECWQQARVHYPHLPRPRIWCDLRGRSAGQAHYRRGGLRFNMTLYREQPAAFLEEIIPHEMAHWIVYCSIARRVRPHGPEWQSVMRRVFNRSPSVTHGFDVTRASPAPWLYRCDCELEHRFTSRRHGMAQRGSRYRCRRCNGLLYHAGHADDMS